MSCLGFRARGSSRPTSNSQRKGRPSFPPFLSLDGYWTTFGSTAPCWFPTLHQKGTDTVDGSYFSSLLFCPVQPWHRQDSTDRARHDTTRRDTNKQQEATRESERQDKVTALPRSIVRDA